MQACRQPIARASHAATFSDTHQVSYDEFAMFLKQGIIMYHTKPDDPAVKALQKAQQLATARVKTPVLPESI
jgi:hypothetical protein